MVPVMELWYLVSGVRTWTTFGYKAPTRTAAITFKFDVFLRGVKKGGGRCGRGGEGYIGRVYELWVFSDINGRDKSTILLLRLLDSCLDMDYFACPLLGRPPSPPLFRPVDVVVVLHRICWVPAAFFFVCLFFCCLV